MSAADEGGTPVITVVRGGPTPAELAAAVAVLLAAVPAPGPAGTRAAAPAAPARIPAWTDRARARQVLPRPGPHSWRASALPR